MLKKTLVFLTEIFHLSDIIGQKDYSEQDLTKNVDLVLPGLHEIQYYTICCKLQVCKRVYNGFILYLTKYKLCSPMGGDCGMLDNQGPHKV